VPPDGVATVERRSALTREHEIVDVLEPARHPMLTERRHERRRRVDRADGGPSLRLLEPTVLVDAPPNPHAPRLPINIAPPEAEQLPAPHPRRHGGEQERPSLRCGRVEQPMNLRGPEHTHLVVPGL